MIAIIGMYYRNKAHYMLYRSYLPIYGIAIIFYFLMIMKETLAFLSLSNPILQYVINERADYFHMEALIHTNWFTKGVTILC